MGLLDSEHVLVVELEHETYALKTSEKLGVKRGNSSRGREGERMWPVFLEKPDLEGGLVYLDGGCII